MSLSGGFRVHGGFGDLGEQLVGCLFFIEGRLEQLSHIVEAERVCPGDHRAVPADFIVLDGLCPGNQSRIKSIGALELLHNLLALLDDAEDRIAGLLLRRSFDKLEYLSQPLDMSFALTLMGLKCLLQVERVSSLSHFRKRIEYLLLREVDVFERFIEKSLRFGSLEHSPSGDDCYLNE